MYPYICTYVHVFDPPKWLFNTTTTDHPPTIIYIIHMGYLMSPLPHFPFPLPLLFFSLPTTNIFIHSHNYSRPRFPSSFSPINTTYPPHHHHIYMHPHISPASPSSFSLLLYHLPTHHHHHHIFISNNNFPWCPPPLPLSLLQYPIIAFSPPFPPTLTSPKPK